MKKCLLGLVALVIIATPVLSGQRGAILFYNNQIAFVDGQRVYLPAPATMIDGQTMVPLEFMANLTKSNVSTDDGFISIQHNERDKPKVYFDKGTEKPLSELIRSAKNEIYLQLYWLSRENIITDLIDASKRGVKICAILDNHKTNYVNGKRLKDEGADIEYDWKTRDYHRKLAVFDERFVWMGSTNWTRDGFDYNAEICFLLDDMELANDLLIQMKIDFKEAKEHNKDNNAD